VPGSESLSVDSNSAVPLYVFTLFLPISRSQKPFLYYIARKKWVIPLLGMICWASPLKVSDLEPGTLQVNAEMLFEKFNQTALLIGAAFKTEGAAHLKREATVKYSAVHKQLRY
jgi:hypothetical protein